MIKRHPDANLYINDRKKAEAKELVSILDVFQGQLSLDEIMQIEKPFLDELLNARVEYLQEKRKLEDEEMTRLQEQANANKKRR